MGRGRGRAALRLGLLGAAAALARAAVPHEASSEASERPSALGGRPLARGSRAAGKSASRMPGVVGAFPDTPRGMKVDGRGVGGTAEHGQSANCSENPHN